MYQTMAMSETTPDAISDRTPAVLEFARTLQAAHKIVYSKSLETASTPKSASSGNSTRMRFATLSFAAHQVIVRRILSNSRARVRMRR
jgi:Tfp pilus assembly protein FimT